MLSPRSLSCELWKWGLGLGPPIHLSSLISGGGDSFFFSPFIMTWVGCHEWVMRVLVYVGCHGHCSSSRRHIQFAERFDQVHDFHLSETFCAFAGMTIVIVLLLLLLLFFFYFFSLIIYLIAMIDVPMSNQPCIPGIVPLYRDVFFLCIYHWILFTEFLHLLHEAYILVLFQQSRIILAS